MIMTLKVSEIRELLNRGVRFERYDGYTSNSSKVIKGYEIVDNMLKNVAQDTTYIVESTSGKTKRPFEMPNLGSVVECLINNIYDKQPKKVYSKHFNDNEPDIMIGKKAYEIKTSLNGSSKCTKVQPDRSVILVNQKGIFTIKKEEIQNLLDNQKKLPYNMEMGKHYKRLENKITMY